MKYFLLSLFAFVFLVGTQGCGSAGNSAQEQAKQLAKEIQKAQPGTTPVSDNGFQLQCKIDGDNWIATSMYPPQDASKIIGYIGVRYVSLPYYRDYADEKTKLELGESHPVDIFLEDETNWTTQSGEILIGTVGAEWIEGSFHCTMQNPAGKKLEITDGFFRIPREKP